MKKFLLASTVMLIILCGKVEAAPVDDLNAQIETQQMGTSNWANFRDKYLLGRETENERRDRKDWEKRHRYAPPPPHHHRYGPPPRGHHYPPPPRR